MRDGSSVRSFAEDTDRVAPFPQEPRKAHDVGFSYLRPVYLGSKGARDFVDAHGCGTVGYDCDGSDEAAVFVGFNDACGAKPEQFRQARKRKDGLGVDRASGPGVLVYVENVPAIAVVVRDVSDGDSGILAVQLLEPPCAGLEALSLRDDPVGDRSGSLVHCLHGNPE